MNILIITYSREVNPGTFLQAFGVQYMLHQLYPKAQIDLIKRKRTHSIFNERKLREQASKPKDWMFIKSKIVAIPRRLKYEYAYRHYFKLTQEEFDFFDYDETEFKTFAERYDLIVVGSDTILINLQKNGKYGLMWLMNIEANKILFAASAAPINYNLTEQQVNELRNSFANFKFLGVRDQITYNLLNSRIGLNNRVYMQADPTYLIPNNLFDLPFYTKRKIKRIKKKSKIALVNFSITGCPFKKELTEYIKSLGYYTVSTLYNENADYNLMALSPFEWGGLFKYIDIAVTERFHDSVFTLRNNKIVIAIDWKQTRFSVNGCSKMSNLLADYGLENMHFIITNIKESHILFEKIRILDESLIISKIKKYNTNIAMKYKDIKEYIASIIK